jgi:hypothetical protein
MRTHFLGAALAVGLIAGAPQAGAVEAIGVLNDTGQTICYDPEMNGAPCADVAADDAGAPGQDGRYGRDAAAALGRLPKVGGGEAGFDFTRLGTSGEAEGEGDCPSPPPLPQDDAGSRAYWTTDPDARYPMLQHVLDFDWGGSSGQCREATPSPPPYRGPGYATLLLTGTRP